MQGNQRHLFIGRERNLSVYFFAEKEVTVWLITQ
nr:MAG TPA: hypothetical protein [Caudoviricetes sp.]